VNISVRVYVRKLSSDLVTYFFWGGICSESTQNVRRIWLGGVFFFVHLDSDFDSTQILTGLQTVAL